MPRYIDADKVVKWSYSEPRYSDSVNDRTDLRDFLLSLPTVSPDEVRDVGKWIVKQTATGREYTSCSRCDIVFYCKSRSGEFEPVDMRGCIYCMGCGARMKGAEDAT